MHMSQVIIITMQLLCTHTHTKKDIAQHIYIYIYILVSRLQIKAWITIYGLLHVDCDMVVLHTIIVTHALVYQMKQKYTVK